jgi:non-specific serine/threonine protein kinase/serine/threonine-protein kinase
VNTGEQVTRLDDSRHELDRDSRVGPYRLIRPIGRGGMGAVYLAVRDDDVFQKRVAIKLLKRGMDTEAIVRRFQHERQILAALEHPNIASLLDGGTTADGLPYFAMEYVEGQPITEYCDGRQLDTNARLELFRHVCAAVQYAHQNLIVHRDIKPANVLVTNDGTPKLLDFGIAKLLNPELAGHTMVPTVAGMQLLTPEYASPEQVRGETVTTATDVYSLGVLLYELLTARLPYRLTGRTAADVLRAVCESPPVRPSTAVTQLADQGSDGGDAHRTDAAPQDVHTRATDGVRPARRDLLRRRLAGDLDNILLKALSKEPARRYASVDQFSEDVRRHLSGLPVVARKDTLAYRTAKFVRRNRAVVVAGVLTLVALVGGMIATAWQARVARLERARAEARFNDLRYLANAAIFDLHDAIRELPGATPARQLLVTKGVEYLDKLSAATNDRVDIQRERASGYVKLGDVLGRPFNPNLGDTGGAVANYRKAAGILESLGAASSPDASLRRELATAYLRLSEVLSSTGDTSDALSFAKQGLALQTQGGSVSVLPADAQREVVAGYTRVGDLLSNTGDTRGALEHRRRAVAMMEALTASAPNEIANLRQLAIAYQKLGNNLGNPNYPNVGDFDGAFAELEKSTAVLERANGLYPNNAMFQKNLAVINSNAADVMLALKRPDEALVRQQRALASFETLAAADPSNVVARNDLAISVYKIAEMMDARGNAAEAVRQYQRALSIHQALMNADPANDAYKLEVASDYSSLGVTQAKRGERHASIANHSRAVDMVRELSRNNPSNAELRLSIALALTGRADAHALLARTATGATRRQDLTSAERDYTEAVGLMSQLQEEGAIAGTDQATLDRIRRDLDSVRRELGG